MSKPTSIAALAREAEHLAGRIKKLSLTLETAKTKAKRDAIRTARQAVVKSIAESGVRPAVIAALYKDFGRLIDKMETADVEVNQGDPQWEPPRELDMTDVLSELEGIADLIDDAWPNLVEDVHESSILARELARLR